MNNKLMSYDDALKRLRILESGQRSMKAHRKTGNKDFRSGSQRSVSQLKTEINILLTIIHLHKQSRKLWGKLNEKT